MSTTRYKCGHSMFAEDDKWVTVEESGKCSACTGQPKPEQPPEWAMKAAEDMCAKGLVQVHYQYLAIEMLEARFGALVRAAEAALPFIDHKSRKDEMCIALEQAKR